jgi:hypothetical protein
LTWVFPSKKTLRPKEQRRKDVEEKRKKWQNKKAYH